MWEERATLSASFWIQTFRSHTYSKLRFHYKSSLSCKRHIPRGNLSTSRVMYLRTSMLTGIQVSEVDVYYLSSKQKEGKIE
jgi:hypothetical protein